ncbi:uncharacterized protein LOC128891675 [Hylaeus anthracinus]|uniref:uncharacterized protein LOC128891675 n=1 Tax=Hylaeus anthracinus TaxID=313031 RepID=UPI0023BA093E|nr:uncharacterized protein LOC128891675 [Hylaeus anthracinus]
MQVNNSQIRDNTEKTILALLLSRKGGCSLSQLLGDYYETEGEQLPWKSLGYLSPLSFLQSMYKSVRVEYRNDTPFIKGIASDKSKHISKLVAGQKNIQKYPVGRKSYRPSHYYPNTGPLKVRVSAEILAKVIGRINQNPDGIDKDCLLRYVQSEMPHVNIVMSDLEEQLRELSHKIYQTRNKVFPNRRESTNLDSADRVLVTAGGNEDYDEENDFDFIPSGYIPPCTSAKTKATSSFIKDSVSKCQDRFVECETVEYTSRVQVDQNSLYNFHNYNYDTQVETQRQTNGDVDKKSTSSDDENVEILVSKRVRFRLEKLIENSPDGIWCADLPQKYLQEYRISLNYTELGFNSVREFASHLPDIFHCVQPYDTGDFMLYYAKREIPTDKQKGKQKIVNLAELHNIYNTDDQVEALPTSLSVDTCKKLIPDDIVTIGESVGQLDVTEFANADKPYIEVIVVEVFTPSFFWIQLRKKQQMFKSFMDELHNFYVLKHHDYIMPPVVLEKGLNCACMYNNIWHRGIIKTVRPDLQVTVMFYDYGTLKTYPPEAIHYLHRMFSAIPAQAIPCGLINTRPYKGSKWSSNATHNFAVRTSQIPLIATIASINTEDNSMLVTLTDTLEEEDVHINDWLVEKKLAQHGKMGDKVDMDNLLLYVEENLLFSPKRCYEEEISDVRNDPKSPGEKSTNMPLVSPQSTLDNKPLAVPPGFGLSRDESQKLQTITEENVQDQTAENDSPSTMPNPNISNTNPFLQDDNQIKCDLTPDKFLKLWNDNLKLQMQITATFHILFNQVMKNSSKGIDDDPVKDTNKLNIPNNMFPHTEKDIPTTITTTASLPSVNSSNTGPVTATFTVEPLHASTSYNGNVKPSFADFLRNYYNFDAIRESLANTRVLPDFDNINVKSNMDNQSHISNYANINDVPTFLEKSTNNKIPFKETNPFKLSLAGKLRLDSEDENYLTPISHKDQDRLIDKHDSISYEQNSNLGSINHANDIPEKLYKDSSFNSQKYFHANNTTNNLSVLNEKFISNDRTTWPMVNVTNDMSKIIINKPFIMHDVNQVKEMNNESVANTQNCNYARFSPYTPSYLRISSQEHVIDQKHKENPASVPCLQTIERTDDQTTCNTNRNSVTKTNDFSECTSTSSPWLPFNSFLPLVPVIQDNNTSTDKDYLTRMTTSNISCTSAATTLIKPTNEAAAAAVDNNHLQSPIRNSNDACGTFVKDWIKTVQDIANIQLGNCDTMSSSFKGNENVEIASCIKNPADEDNVLNQFNINRLDVNNFHARGNELRNIWKPSISTQSTYSDNNSTYLTYPMSPRIKIFFSLIDLPNERTIHIFHHRNDGWLLANEFIMFTEFQTFSCMLNFSNIFNIRIPFEEIDKSLYSMEYIEPYIRPLSMTTRDIINNPSKLQLIPLRVIFRLLSKCRDSQKNPLGGLIYKPFKDPSTPHEIMQIIQAYRQFKNHIENFGKL